jgi:YjjG family noncanonical pyrimidine nucleotidase
MSVKKYKCIFFDLDHTLWDYETNSRETLSELYFSYDLHNKGVFNLETFQQQFKEVNTDLWDLFDRGIITSEVIRKERFKRILGYFHAYDAKLCEDLSTDYLYNCPKKGNLMPHAVDVLEYLAGHYALTLVTNGFEEIQNVKLTAGNLHRFFNHIITSQKAGHRKPSREIFDYAMNANAIKCCDAVMIGDNLVTDIGGARNASIDTIFFNPEKINHSSEVSHEISCLSELPRIL